MVNNEFPVPPPPQKKWYGGVESKWVHSALWPPVGLLCQPQVIMMMEKVMEW
jgi:hypothetical protein